MAAPILQYIKLKDIVLLYIEAAKKTDAEFLRLWRLAFRGFSQMGINAFWAAKQIVIPVNSNLTATLPDDYLQWIRIGTFNQNGEFRILSVNNSLSTFGDLSSNRLSAIQSQVSQLEPFLIGNPVYATPYVSETDSNYDAAQFGLGSRLLTDGSCKVDVRNRCIIFDVNFSNSTVALEYIYSPEMDEDYEIPFEFQEAMLAWLNWQDKIYVPATSKGGAADKQIAAQNFKNQLLLARKTYKPVRIMETELYFRDAQKYSVKG
jgi:hypothetical protein